MHKRRSFRVKRLTQAPSTSEVELNGNNKANIMKKKHVSTVSLKLKTKIRNIVMMGYTPVLEMYPHMLGIWLMFKGIIVIAMWFVSMIMKITGSWNKFTEKCPKHNPDKQKVKEPPGDTNKRKQIGRKRLLRLGIIAAMNLVAQTPKFYTKKDEECCKILKPYRGKKGHLKTKMVPVEMMPQLQQILKMSGKGEMLGDDRMFDVLADTGCTQTATSYLSDFEEGSLIDLETPIVMEGVAGNIEVRQKGKVNWEFITTEGEVIRLSHYAHYAPSLKGCRLMSPQDIFKQYDPKAKLTLQNKKMTIEFSDGKKIQAPIQEDTGVPIFTGFKNVEETAISIAKANVIARDNSNLDPNQKITMRWHYKLGHLTLRVVKWLARQNIIGPRGHIWGKATVKEPRCETCIMGKQSRTPVKGVKKKRENEGVLVKGKYIPGDLVFTDQLVSSLTGRYYNDKGQQNTNYLYRGATIFWDAASHFIYLNNQVGFTAYETIESKVKFEREANSVGVKVKQYSTDNGVYQAQDFLKNVAAENQTLRSSGVGAHHQNGLAENAIKIIVQKARTMMFHSALCWPESTDLKQWPLALNHAVALYNETPNPEIGLAPIEIWSNSKSTYSYLKQAHPWGCPAYVLQPKLQDGMKIPKWQPRSRQGVYMGFSPIHASSVGIIKNPRTGNISPQYNVVYDDFFETVHSNDDKTPDIWEELVMFS